MGKSEEDEVAELKQMFRSPNKRNSMQNRPAWDPTPLRYRPSALVGLKPVTREPWYDTSCLSQPLQPYFDQPTRSGIFQPVLVS